MARPDGHYSDQITAYLSDALEPEEKAAFEAHLATCKECQEDLADQRKMFDEVNKAIAFEQKQWLDEQVAKFEQEVGTERLEARAAGTPDRRPPPAFGTREEMRQRRRWAIPAAVAVAASAAVVFVVLDHPGRGVGPGTMAGGEDAGRDKGYVAAPHGPEVEVDGGVDGGPGDRKW